MSTVTKKCALEMMRNNGQYEGDPDVYAVWEYASPWTKEPSYAIFYNSWELPVNVSAQLLWCAGHLTPRGEQMIEEDNRGR